MKKYSIYGQTDELGHKWGMIERHYECLLCNKIGWKDGSGQLIVADEFFKIHNKTCAEIRMEKALK